MSGFSFRQPLQDVFLSDIRTASCRPKTPVQGETPRLDYLDRGRTFEFVILGVVYLMI